MERAALLAALLCVACASNGSSDPIAEAPASTVPTGSAAPVDSQAQPCPIAPLTLVSEEPNRPVPPNCELFDNWVRALFRSNTNKLARFTTKILQSQKQSVVSEPKCGPHK